MAIEPFDLLRELRAVRQTMDRVLAETFAQGLGASGVPVDVFETDEDVVVRACLCGARPEDLDIAVQSNAVTLRAELKTQEGVPPEQIALCELPHGTVTRTLELPAPVDAERARAVLEHGLLTLTVPKTAAARGRRIPVETRRGAAPGGPEARPSPQPPAGERVSAAPPPTAAPGAPRPQAAALASRIRIGMDVCASDGSKIGTVGRVYSTAGVSPGPSAGQGEIAGPAGYGAVPEAEFFLRVDTGFLGLGRDLYVPSSHVRDVTERCVVLDVPRNQVDQMGWTQRPAFVQD